MTRHFLALFALLSGLAALSGPAHASANPLSSCNIGASAEASEARSHVPAALAIAGDRTVRRCREMRDAPCPARVEGLRLPVLAGVERALE